MLQRPDADPLTAARGQRVIRLNPGPQASVREAQPKPAALLQTLSELAREVGDAHTPGHLANLVVQCVCHALGAASAALYLRDEPGDLLSLVASSDGAETLDPRIASAESLAARVVTEQRSVFIDDYVSWRKASRLFEPAGFTTAAAVPLSTGNHVIGALVARFRSQAQDPGIVDVLSLVGMIASVPLETAALRERLRDEEKLDGALRRMTQALAAHENEGRVLWLAVRYASQLLKAPFARAWLLQDDGSLVCAAAEGYLEPDPIGLRLPPECVAGLVVSSGPINLTDATAHPGWYPLSSLGTGLRAYVGAPMRRAGRPLGVLTVMREVAFERTSEHLLTTLADASAAAVDNARALARAGELARTLAETRQRYRLLFEHTPMGVVELDANGNVTGVNPAWERLSGQSANAAIGRTSEGLTSQTRASTVRTKRLHVTVGGELVGGCELVEDLIERDRAVQLQREEARRRAAIADVASWALTSADLNELLHAAANGAALALDAEFATLYELDPTGDGFTLRAAAGAAHEFAGPTNAAGGAASQAGYTILQGEPVLVNDLASEQRFVPDQHLLACEVSSSLSVAVSGRAQVYGVLGIHSRRHNAFSESSAAFLRSFGYVLALAITYRKSEEALYRRGQEVSALVEHVPDVVVRVDADLKFTFVNAPIEWATGRPASTFIGLGIEVLGIPETMLHLVQLRFKHVFRTGRTQVFDLPLIGPAGQHEYETYLIPEMSRDGSVAAVLAVARDVTERRRAETEREEQQRQLMAHEQRLEELLAQMIAGQAREQHRRAEVAKLEPLSAREKQVLRLLADGRTNSEIALELLVSPGTVKNHISRILPKLGAVDRTQAAARAVELGLLGS